MTNYHYTYTLPSLVAQSAKKFPHKAAFRFLNTSITYQELLEKMHQLAHLLIDLGVKKGDRVGIYMARSLETAVAMFGIMSAGAVYVPINPFQPVARTHFLLKDGKIKHLITNAAQKRALPSVITTEAGLESVIGVELDHPVRTIAWEKLNDFPTDAPDIPILEIDTAYILYTSGSTGTPKGIMHSHYSGLAYAKLSAEIYDLHEADILGNHAPIYFDISTLGYFAAPLVGATTVIVSEAHLKMPASLSQLIEKEKVSVWYSVPLALIQMLQMGALDQRKMTQLRWVIFAGELFPTKHLRQLMIQWPHPRFSNAYGPTETNVCTYYHLPEIPNTDAPISIGKAWGNTEILIVDEKNQAVPKGQVGELLVRSATLMQGYAGRSDLNEKVFFFIENQWGIRQRFYRTGDLVKEETDGNLTFLGRKDRQIKTRGYRVELDEITTLLLQHPAVEEAAVYPFLNQEEQTLIEAAVILKADKKVEEQDLLLHLQQLLPPYAIPQQIMLKQEFPRTATGKIDLKTLKQNE